METTIIFWILGFGEAIILVILTVGIKGLFAINTNLGQMNGSIKGILIWQVGHEKLDDERVRLSTEAINNMGQALETVNARCREIFMGGGYDKK